MCVKNSLSAAENKAVLPKETELEWSFGEDPAIADFG